ncbi:uncharacterized protein LOC123685934 [Harmonia axyridis]|uniref:uncharacterized protein LOC123685934 n=1 Tax=Harmonia axyridis TaxID=115357 RepID=UPI001E278A37|nr:uncharacterized protein LOC123685934 [Harmonia axyridis]
MNVLLPTDIEDNNKLPPEAVDTAELILFMDKLFDSLNTSKRLAPSGKPLQGGVTTGSPHLAFWRSSIPFLQNMKFFCKNKNCLVSVPSIRNFIFSVRGFIRLTKNLLSKHKFKYVLTRAFNQDPLENFFGAIRSHGARHISPDASHFENSFKALLINNFLSSHSPNSNCENDESEGALNNLYSFLNQNLIVESDCSIESPIIPNLPPNVSLTRKSRVAENTLVYISGYLVRRLSKILKCSDCKQLLQSNHELVQNVDFIEARRYNENSKLLIPGSFFIT